MNTKRILVGGLLAGALLTVSEGILNAVILMDDYAALMEQYGLSEASWAMIGYIGGTFVFGFVVAWLYAAMRPRFGAGAATAVRAGTVLWVIGYAVPTVWFSASGLTLSAGLTALALAWGLVELILAGLVAGWVYREGEPASTRREEREAAPAV